MKIAVIDVGSNSIRYMEAELSATGFGFSDKSIYTTRLATGLITSGKLAEDRMETSIEVLHVLADRAKKNALPCFCYATSAVRDAENKDVFLSRVLSNTGLNISVLSGEEEASYARLGASSSDGGLIDIGGGSSQVITEIYRKSFPLGCVRVKDLCKSNELCSMRNTLFPVFETVYQSLPHFPTMPWVAVGGTATTLAALSLGISTYDATKIREVCLSQADLDRLLHSLDAMGSKRRAAHPLLVKRHDVICGGGLILMYLMQHIGIEQIRFSDADGLEGYAICLLKAATV